MDSLVGYGSDDDVETERGGLRSVVGYYRRREDDTNYESVNMDLSEESPSGESESERPSGWSAMRRPSRECRRTSFDGRDKERTRSFCRNRVSGDLRDRVRPRNRAGPSPRDRERDGPDPRDRERDGACQRERERDGPGPRERERDGPGPRDRERDGHDPRDRDRDGPEPRDRERDDRRDKRRDERDRRSPKRDDRHKDRFHGIHDRRRSSLSDRHDEKADKMPALMNLKPYDGEPSPRGTDVRDAVSPRFIERGRRDRDRERERDRDRGKESRHSRRPEESKSARSDRSRSRGKTFPPPQALSSNDRERRGSPPERPSGEYRPSSYKVNRKLEVMEKMGLQIKTPDGSMTTAQQLRAAASEAPGGLPPYYNPTAVHSNKALDQKRKLLWAHKEKSDSTAACWSGARFAQDDDGKQVSKFMRLMGIKDGASTASKPEAAEADPNKKQEELFQAMQAQYEVARATTHTMRGVGLGFQRGNF